MTTENQNQKQNDLPKNIETVKLLESAKNNLVKANNLNGVFWEHYDRSIGTIDRIEKMLSALYHDIGREYIHSQAETE